MKYACRLSKPRFYTVLMAAPKGDPGPSDNETPHQSAVSNMSFVDGFLPFLFFFPLPETNIKIHGKAREYSNCATESPTRGGVAEKQWERFGRSRGPEEDFIKRRVPSVIFIHFLSSGEFFKNPFRRTGVERKLREKLRVTMTTGLFDSISVTRLRPFLLGYCRDL